MWTILEAAEFLQDSPLTFNYRRNNGYFTFNAISVYEVYIDFRIKIQGRLFVNDKQILTMFQIIFNPLRSGGNKSSYILKAAGLFKYVWPFVTTRC